MGFVPFVESFVVDVIWEAFNIITSLPMFANPHATFIMLSLCSAQYPSYLLHIIFLFHIYYNIMLNMIHIP
jgi:hypothetical protein